MKGCEICSARQRKRIFYKDRALCSECYYEYRMITEGQPSNKTSSKIDSSGNDHPDNHQFDIFKLNKIIFGE